LAVSIPVLRRTGIARPDQNNNELVRPPIANRRSRQARHTRRARHDASRYTNHFFATRSQSFEESDRLAPTGASFALARAATAAAAATRRAPIRHRVARRLRTLRHSPRATGHAAARVAAVAVRTPR